MSPFPEIDLSESGASYAPQLGFAAIDAGGVSAFIPDATNQSSHTSRIVRLNLLTLAWDVWLDHGAGLPPGVSGVAFSSDYSALFACTGDADTRLLKIDPVTKAVTDLGDIGTNLDTLAAIGPGRFVGLHRYTKSLYLVEVSSGGAVVITPDFLPCNAWTPGIAVSAAGDIFRAYQKGGPGTDGPIFRYISSRPGKSAFVAGYLHNSGEISDGTAYSARFAAESLAVTPDGQTVYFTQGNRLKAISGGTVTELGDVYARAVLGVGIGGRVLTAGNSAVIVWL